MPIEAQERIAEPRRHLSSEMLVGYATRCPHRGRHLFPDLGERVMRMSSSLVAPSAVAVLSAVLLSGTAASQTATGPNQLPSITVQAPQQVARPHRPVAGAAGANRVAARP